jgi:chaperonin GroEL
MAKQILYGDEARRKIVQGINKSSEAVLLTLGLGGRNVMFENINGKSQVTNDGNRTSREVVLEDKFENLGANLVQEVASKSVYGGTTTTVSLFNACASEGAKKIKKGSNAMDVRRGMEHACIDATLEMLKLTSPAQDSGTMRNIAITSSEIPWVGDMIVNVLDKVGNDGVVTVEESPTSEVYFETSEGMEIDRGYASPNLVNDTEKMECVMTDAYVLVTDEKITNLKQILPVLEAIMKSGDKKQLVIVAEDFGLTFMKTIVLNHRNGAFSVLAIKAPGYGDSKREKLEDLAVITGGTFFSKEAGMPLKNLTLSKIGLVSKVTSKSDSTLFVGNDNVEGEVKKRVTYLKSLIKKNTSKFEKDKIQERIAKLSGGVATIYVGAPTDTEMKYLKGKIDDAVKETKIALAEGVVMGGGATLAKVATLLKRKERILRGDRLVGYGIVVDALTQPLIQIMKNAGIEKGHWWNFSKRRKYLSILRHTENPESVGGFTVTQGMVDDMFNAGVIDALKVTRTALENAVSASGILLTTECAIVNK